MLELFLHHVTTIQFESHKVEADRFIQISFFAIKDMSSSWNTVYTNGSNQNYIFIIRSYLNIDVCVYCMCSLGFL